MPFKLSGIKRLKYHLLIGYYMQRKQLKPELKIADKFLDLKTMDTNIILNHLDEQIRLREMPVEKRLKKDLLK